MRFSILLPAKANSSDGGRWAEWPNGRSSRRCTRAKEEIQTMKSKGTDIIEGASSGWDTQKGPHTQKKKRKGTKKTSDAQRDTTTWRSLKSISLPSRIKSVSTGTSRRPEMKEIYCYWYIQQGVISHAKEKKKVTSKGDVSMSSVYFGRNWSDKSSEPSVLSPPAVAPVIRQTNRIPSHEKRKKKKTCLFFFGYFERFKGRLCTTGHMETFSKNLARVLIYRTGLNFCWKKRLGQKCPTHNSLRVYTLYSVRLFVFLCRGIGEAGHALTRMPEADSIQLSLSLLPTQFTAWNNNIETFHDCRADGQSPGSKYARVTGLRTWRG